MPDLTIRLGVLLLVGGLTGLIFLVGRSYVNRRRRQALAALPLTEGAVGGAVRILAFSTETCRQCHTHQWPAVQRVVALRAGSVAGEDVDAILHADLAERYHILTVPSTVVLDAGGRVQAVNYGFTNTQALLKQIDAIL